MSFVRGHPVRYWFKPSGVRNEALDRRVYALAALHAHPVPWDVPLRAAPTEPPPPFATARPGEPLPPPPALQDEVMMHTRPRTMTLYQRVIERRAFIRMLNRV